MGSSFAHDVRDEESQAPASKSECYVAPAEGSTTENDRLKQHEPVLSPNQERPPDQECVPTERAISKPFIFVAPLPAGHVGRSCVGRMSEAMTTTPLFDVRPNETLVAKTIAPLRPLSQWKSTREVLIRDLNFYTMCSHAALAPVIGISVDQNAVIVWSDYAPMGNLVSDLRKLEEPTLKKLLVEVGCGLRYLNSRQLPHRHLTLENVLQFEQGTVLSDCGLGSLFLGMTADDVYAMGYRSSSMFPPETIAPDAEGIDPEKCDVWAFGCIAYQLAFGCQPFRGETKEELFAAIKRGNPEHLTDGNDKFSKDFIAFVTLCMNPDPTQRPQMMALLRHGYMKTVLLSVREYGGNSGILKGLLISPVPGPLNPDILVLPPPDLCISIDPLSAAVPMIDSPDVASAIKVSVALPPLPTPIVAQGGESGPGTDSLSSTPRASPGSAARRSLTPLSYRTLSLSYPDAQLVEDVIICNSCHTIVKHSFLSCNDCEFILCAVCIDQGVLHNPAHHFAPFAIEDVREEQLPRSRLTSTSSTKSSRRRLPRPSDSTSLTSGPRKSQISAASSFASTKTNPIDPSSSMPKKRSWLVIPTAIMDEDEKTRFSMSGRSALSKLHMLRSRTRSTSSMFSKPEAVIQDCEDTMNPELDLHMMNMKVVPGIVFDGRLAHLLSLDLSENSLTELPFEIGFLSNLQELRVSNNQLKALPDGLGDLGSLETLDANHNQLEDLPQTFMFAESLATLSLDYNNFKSIPEVIFDMASLQTAYFAANTEIAHLPPIELFSHIQQPLQLGLDNELTLFREYEENAGKLKNVTVMWNKIYPDEVIPGLFCGSLRSAQTPHVYERLKITHILTAGRGLEPLVVPGMRQLTIQLDDVENASISHMLEPSFEFIDEALKSGGGCLVHCFAGMSRSAVACIAYLMRSRSMRLDDAYNLTKKARPAIYPNRGFFNQLLAYDKELFPDGRPLDIDSMHREIVP